MAAELVTARGDSASLAARLGSVSTLEDEVTSARLTYSSVSQAIQAVSRSGVLWGNVRIVAKTGGQYTTIQAAVTSVTGTDPCVILIMPGTYAEDVDVTDKVVDFVGLGKVVVEGHLHTSGDFMYVSLIENIRFINASPTEADPLLTLSGENGCHVRHCQFVYAGLADAVATTGNGKVFDACIFWGEPQGSSALLSVGHVGDAVDVVVKYCRFSTSASTKPCIKVVQTDKVCSLRLFHSTLKTVTSAAVVGSGTKADLILYHGHNAYNVAPDSGTLTIVVDTQDGTSSNSIFSDTNALPVIL